MATITFPMTITADTAAEYTDYWNRCLARIAEGITGGGPGGTIQFSNLRVSGPTSARKMIVDVTIVGAK
jgi:hypothetical protein